MVYAAKMQEQNAAHGGGGWQQCHDKLEVPMDVLSQRAEVDAVILPSGAPAVNTELLALAAKLLVQAKNPMIYVGGGAQGVSAEVLILAEMLEAPVVGYRTGMGIG